jgi:hypothetical protein
MLKGLVSWKFTSTANQQVQRCMCGALFPTESLHSRMSLDPKHVRLKLLHAWDQWHYTRKFTPLTGLHCKLCATRKADYSNEATSAQLTWTGDGAEEYMIRRNSVPVYANRDSYPASEILGAQVYLGTATSFKDVDLTEGAVRVFRPKFTLEDAIGFLACSLVNLKRAGA